MKDWQRLHDMRVETPALYETDGDIRLSEVVLVFPDDGVPVCAQYGSDGYFHGEGDETFGRVSHWCDLILPSGYVLDRSLDHTPTARVGHSFDEPLRQRVRTWPFWRDLGIYFIVFSFAGHWAEMLFCYNIHLGVFMGDVDFSEVMLWHQWLFPYFAEGVAVALIVVLLTPVKEWLLKKFGGRILPAVLVSIVVTAAVCTTVDFTCGMICNQNYEVWDYRAIPFNFMGQVCLQNSTVYTVAALLILWVFYPLMDRGLRRMPRSLANGLFFALVGVYAFSALLHFMYVGDAGLVVGDFVMKPE